MHQVLLRDDLSTQHTSGDIVKWNRMNNNLWSILFTAMKDRPQTLGKHFNCKSRENGAGYKRAEVWRLRSLQPPYEIRPADADEDDSKTRPERAVQHPGWCTLQKRHLRGTHNQQPAGDHHRQGKHPWLPALITCTWSTVTPGTSTSAWKRSRSPCAIYPQASWLSVIERRPLQGMGSPCKRRRLKLGNMAHRQENWSLQGRLPKINPNQKQEQEQEIVR